MRMRRKTATTPTNKFAKTVTITNTFARYLEAGIEAVISLYTTYRTESEQRIRQKNRRLLYSS